MCRIPRFSTSNHTLPKYLYHVLEVVRQHLAAIRRSADIETCQESSEARNWISLYFWRSKTKRRRSPRSSPRIGYVTHRRIITYPRKQPLVQDKRTTRLSEIEDLSNQTACCVSVFSNTSQISICALPCCTSVSRTATNFIRMGLVVAV